MLMLFLVNLGFAGGGAPVVVQTPATTAGGGRKERNRIPRYHRSMVYAPLMDQERKKHRAEIKEIQQELQKQAEEIANKERIEIEEARSRVLQSLILSKAVNRSRITSDRLIRALNQDATKAAIQKALKSQLETEQALLSILMACESYEA